MRGRIGPLTPPALLCVLLALASCPSTAHAHRLVVECRLLPDHRIQVEGWYNSVTGPHPARQAKVRVQDAAGGLVAEGELDSEGFFTFPYEGKADLTVVVSQTGHREQLLIPASRLEPPQSSTDQSQDSAPSAPRAPPIASSAMDETRERVKEILIGVGFVLAVAAFALSLRNARALRRIKDERK